MKLAILHHHLNRGGVTQVVRNHLRALRIAGPRLQLSEVLVLHGGRAEGWPTVTGDQDGFGVRVDSVRGLDYDDRCELCVDELTEAIALALHSFGFGPDETILHVHNHALGKHVSLPGALRQLAERGYRLLLQIHDFAEDLRPANFERFRLALEGNDVGRYLYPSARHIHYALLNSRDRDLFLGTNIDTTRVHFLPNPVQVAAALPPHEQALRVFQATHGLSDSQRMILYPVRGIRRKNLGELLLWSALADARTVFALTLPASSEAEVPAFRRWRALAGRLGLQVLFDVGLQDNLSFEDNLAAASRIITTSVAEGFGLVFLESWLHQRLLIGRNLPEITRDFLDRGVNLDHLGDSVRIPIAWVGVDEFVDKVLALQRQLCVAYGQNMPSTTAATLRAVVAAGHVDFASLPTENQVAVIERAAQDHRAAAALLDLNPWMLASLEGDETEWQSVIAANAAAVGSGFSIEATADDLATIYGTLFALVPDEVVTALPEPENILKAFLDVSRLCPVRIEP